MQLLVTQISESSSRLDVRKQLPIAKINNTLFEVIIFCALRIIVLCYYIVAQMTYFSKSYYVRIQYGMYLDHYIVMCTSAYFIGNNG